MAARLPPLCRLPHSRLRLSVPQNGSGQGPSTVEAEADGHAEEVSNDYDDDRVPGFEASASDCFNRARQIARSLNHADLSSDPLMLALIMDPTARRLLERVGDITELRETATQRVGRNYTKSSADPGSPQPTSDLGDVAKKARDAAAEREQLVSISDLINAFPKVGATRRWCRRSKTGSCLASPSR